MENPIKMDDLALPLFSETPIWRQMKPDFYPRMFWFWNAQARP